MIKYITRRAIGIIPTVLLLLFSVVVMVDMIPGDIIDLVLEERANAGPEGDEQRAALERELGLDKPLMLRYVQYVGNLLRGDLGNSLWTGQSVWSAMAGRAVPTIEIGVLAIVMGATFGVVVGTISAVRQDGIIDYALRSFAIAGLSIPNFAIATAVVVFPAIWWGISPSLRFVSFTDAPIDHIKILIPPAIILALSLSASLMRLMRTTVLNELRQDYVRTAQSKGLRYRTVVSRHVMKNALIPVITLMGLQIGFLIGGSVITESVFAIPGLGRMLLGAISQRDYPVLQGIVVVVGFFIILTNLLIDLSYAYIDPRIRYS